MPYRDEQLSERCHQCEKPARAACPCCTRATCPRHLLEDKQMCGTCDEAYYRYMHREDAAGSFLHVLVLFAVAALPPIILSTAFLPVTIAAVFFGFPTILWYRKARDRRLFFAQMKTRGAIAEKATIDGSDEARRLDDYQRKVDDRRAEDWSATFEDAPAEPPPS